MSNSRQKAEFSARILDTRSRRRIKKRSKRLNPVGNKQPHTILRPKEQHMLELCTTAWEPGQIQTENRELLAKLETRRDRSDSTTLAIPRNHLLLLKTSTEVVQLMASTNPERRPASSALAEAQLTILGLYGLGFEIPAADVYTDPDKAIRLLWTRADRSVELVFPSNEDELPYLYRSEQEECGIEEHLRLPPELTQTVKTLFTVR